MSFDRSINTVLFDLDGTLLPQDIEAFMKDYFAALMRKVQGYAEPRGFIDILMEATYAMINDRRPDVTNQSAFMEHFFGKSGLDPERTMNLFAEFYEKDFGALKNGITPNPAARRAVVACRRRGMTVVLATNAVFPERAILERLDWAGLSDQQFDLITSYERMHFCKPHREYYEEILSLIDKRPEECIMVGNDVEEDMIAGKLGIRTFLVTDFMIRRDLSVPLETVAEKWGTLADFAEWVDG